MKNHNYEISIKWDGNLGEGTNDYRKYDRSHIISSLGKPDILGSSDPSFRGDKTRYNPEEILVASLSACHMLWYLHLCTEAGVIVVDYIDSAKGTMIETKDGSGYFNEVQLNPQVVVTDDSMVNKANALHKQAHKMCFIANSVNFKVSHNPKCTVKN